ncbi:butyrophilin subfamily 1 member A1-like isoform X1 [Betta splendens]|uniref:Butyrophilin subfamily 1 member A1-like isoform X1 n=1 Tax=Betta splendens TaxID=158456 RepID=A0A9W2Y7C5_BETSP|nr:butyrophilin subfamily 1 member A1-like isoform X1 [Betta splendens]
MELKWDFIVFIYKALMHLLALLSISAVAQVSGSSFLNCSTPNIVWPGDDVILPCRLQPPLSAESMRVEWTRPDLEPEFIHVHQDGRFLHELQNPDYKNRTSLFVDQLPNGDVSLKLFKVTQSDAGTYRCSLPSVQQEASVQLSVGSEVIGSDQAVQAVVGGDVILPCHMEPPFDVTTLTVEWKYVRAVVHKYKSQKETDSQNDQFKNRTSLFHNEMHKGNISLKLTNVNLTDAGNYTCSVPKLQSQVKKDNVELIVDSKDKKGRDADDSETTALTAGLTIPAVVILIAGVVAGLVWWRRQRNHGRSQAEAPENVAMM